MDELGIEKAHFIGNSQGGQTAMIVAMKNPERVNKLVFGACHIKTGGDLYLMGNRPSEGSRATNDVIADPTRENVRRYLRVHIDDEALVTDELIDYIHQNYTGHPDHRSRVNFNFPIFRLGNYDLIGGLPLMIHGLLLSYSSSSVRALVT